jgi:oligosaccharide repeat unit polymerase
MLINFLIFGILIVLFMASLRGPHRFSPVRIWLVVWTFAFAINFLVGGVYFYSGEALTIVTLGILFYVLGAFSYWGTCEKPIVICHARTQGFIEALIELRGFSYLLTFLILAQLPLINAGMQKFSDSSLLNLLTSGRGRMFEIMKENQAALYLNNEFNFPLEFKLVTLFICFATIFVFFRLSLSRVRGIDFGNAILIGLISLIFSASANVRSLLLVPIIVGFFSFYTGAILTNRTHLFASKYTIFGVVSAVVGFATWILVVQSARMGDPNFERVGETLNHMRPWFAGYIPAVSVWYEEGFGMTEYGWGRYFFRAVLAPLGLVSGEGFDERVDAVNIGNWQTSNAMTIFRVLIADFGPIGAVLSTFMLGYFGELTYRKTICYGGAWLVLLVAFYCAAFFSVNFWFFFYGARVFGFFSAALVVALLSRNVVAEIARERSRTKRQPGYGK